MHMCNEEYNILNEMDAYETNTRPTISNDNLRTYPPRDQA